MNLLAIQKIPIYDEALFSKAAEKQQLHAIEHVARDVSPQKAQGELTSGTSPRTHRNNSAASELTSNTQQKPRQVYFSTYLHPT